MTMLQLQGLRLAYPHQTCFSDFSASVDWGQRIAIVGDNGSGKSSLLRVLHGSQAPDEGRLVPCYPLGVGYVPQQVDDATLSGGERFQRALTAALPQATDLLLLDEPSNHLDAPNRRALLRLLGQFPASLVIVSHDEALIATVCDTIWHLDQGRVTVFHGRYADYQAERARQREALHRQLALTRRAQQAAHQALMQEQERASHARQRGVKNIAERRWATIKSPTKLGRGNTTAGRKQADIREQQQALAAQLDALRQPEAIAPRFHLPAAGAPSTVLQVNDGSVGYGRPLLSAIHLTLEHGERLALCGRNGSGKSTLARAILGDTALRLGGDWHTPARAHIGYLDQHYAGLPPAQSPLQILAAQVPHWSPQQLRHHLSDFMFRHDAAVHAPTATLSGGERARLALACIAASPPQLLILDEPSNNLDLTLRRHLLTVLRGYPGGLLLISHDEDFLEKLGVERRHELDKA